ncbi:hypothetical protein [Cetobacterium somerae]
MNLSLDFTLALKSILQSFNAICNLYQFQIYIIILKHNKKYFGGNKMGLGTVLVVVGTLIDMIEDEE